MKYVPRPGAIEAVFLDTIATGIKFLHPGEYTVITRSGFYILSPSGTIHAPLGECYLIRDWADLIDVMEKEDFEQRFVEDK